MGTSEYRQVVGQGPALGASKIAYVLQVGAFELEPIPYSTLVGLGTRSEVVRQVLDACFIDRSVMWSDSEFLDPDNVSDHLREVESRLQAFDRRLEASTLPPDRVVGRVVKLWHQLTREALARLASPDAMPSPDSALAEYRRSALACVEALIQLLPEQGECSLQGRQRLELGRGKLVRSLGVEPDRIEHAGWRASPEDPDEPGFVTWGIP